MTFWIRCLSLFAITACDASEPATGTPHDGASDLEEGDAERVESSDGDAPGCAAPCARGRLLRDHRAVDATRTHLLDVEVVPVAGLHLIVRSGARALAEGESDAEGRFALTLPEGPYDGPLELALAATVPDPDGSPLVAILDSDGVPVPTGPGHDVVATRLWAWVAAPASAPEEGRPIDFGDVYIREADGAGALALLSQVAPLRERMLAFFSPARVTTLAILWNPALTPSCLSCYLPGSWGHVTWKSAGGDVAFDRAVFFSGAPAAPHHFTPSIVAHELGHWVLDIFSRHPEVGGSHGWDLVAPPPLAWAEGFATFFAQWSQSEVTPEPRFFAVQSNVQYWVDLEALGRPPDDDDTSLALVFPRPTPEGPMTQDLNEAVVAAMLWDLWDGADDGEPIALGDAALRTLATPRLVALDRAAVGPDLVDYLDALACGDSLASYSASDVTAAILGFPWDGAPLCP